MAYHEQDIHIGRTLCLLCRQSASSGSLVLDRSQKQLTVPECRSPCVRCLVTPNPSCWFHKSCHYVLEGSYKASKPTFGDLLKFANAVKPIYKPQDKEQLDTVSTWDGLFSHFTKPIMENSFRQDLFVQLPAEIQTMILNLIGPCWYLIVLGETRRLIELLRNVRGSQCERLSLTKEVYITRTKYQGNAYVSRISSVPFETTCPDVSSQQILKIPSHTRKIALSVDHIGIRGVQFVDKNSDPSPDGSPWYEVLEVPDSHMELRVSCDGVFVRSVRVFPNSSYSAPRTWSSPFPPKFQPWNTHRIRDGCRLDYVNLDADIRGLLVCCSHAKNIGIHGFSNISKSYKTFVRVMNQRSSIAPIYWIFFPLNVDEFIEAAWVRQFKGCNGSASNPALVIQTTSARTATFGPHPPASLQHIYDFHPLVKNGDGVITGIFHDGLDPDSKLISEIGVTCKNDCRAKMLKPEPIFDSYIAPPIPPRGGSPAMSWYMTKAPLEGLLRVRVCRDQEQPHYPCLGLLLYYKDERVESLGQFRWDRDISQKVFSPMCIESSSVGGKDYIKSIQNRTICPGLDLDVGVWQEVPQHGTIVWWFGHLGDKIIIHDD